MAETQETKIYDARMSLIIGTAGTFVLSLSSLPMIYDAIDDFANGRYGLGTFKSFGAAAFIVLSGFSYGLSKRGKTRLAELEQKAKQETLETKVE